MDGPFVKVHPDGAGACVRAANKLRFVASNTVFIYSIS